MPASQHDRERDVPASQQNSTGKEKENDRERERHASLTTELRNMDRSSNSEQHRQMRESRTSEEREQHRSTNSEKKEDNHDHNNLVSYQCIKYFTKLTKIFLHLITASANAYYIAKNYCVIEIKTPVDSPRVSLVIIIMNKSQEL